MVLLFWFSLQLEVNIVFNSSEFIPVYEAFLMKTFMYEHWCFFLDLDICFSNEIYFSDLVLGQSFLSLYPNNTRSGTAYPGCSQVDTESCVRADVDLDLLQNGDFLELSDGTLLELITRGEHSAVFKVRLMHSLLEQSFPFAFLRVKGLRQFSLGTVML